MVAGSDGHAHQKEVKTGIRQQDRVQIVDGLSAGERVVGTGAYGLPDDKAITDAASSGEEKPGEEKPGADKSGASKSGTPAKDEKE
jgi:hypothetical protein